MKTTTAAGSPSRNDIGRSMTIILVSSHQGPVAAVMRWIADHPKRSRAGARARCVQEPACSGPRVFWGNFCTRSGESLVRQVSGNPSKTRQPSTPSRTEKEDVRLPPKGGPGNEKSAHTIRMALEAGFYVLESSVTVNGSLAASQWDRTQQQPANRTLCCIKTVLPETGHQALAGHGDMSAKALHNAPHRSSSLRTCATLHAHSRD